MYWIWIVYIQHHKKRLCSSEGPKTLPWGTTALIAYSLLVRPLSTIRKVPSHRQFSVSCKELSSTLEWSIYNISPLCETADRRSQERSSSYDAGSEWGSASLRVIRCGSLRFSQRRGSKGIVTQTQGEKCFKIQHVGASEVDTASRVGRRHTEWQQPLQETAKCCMVVRLFCSSHGGWLDVDFKVVNTQTVAFAWWRGEVPAMTLTSWEYQEPRRMPSDTSILREGQWFQQILWGFSCK